MQDSREVRQRRGLSVIAGMSLAGVVTLSSFGAMAADLVYKAEPTDCRCLVSRDTQGLIREARGNVMATQRTGFSPVQTNDTTMHLPGRVVTGVLSSSVVALGDRCEVSMGASETAEITAENGRLCLRLVSDPGISPVIPLAVLGGVGVAIAAGSGGGDGPFPVSR